MILASNNAHKVTEVQAILADLGEEIIPQREAGCDFEVEETGTTFEENAYLKAIAVTRATGQPAIAAASPASIPRVIPETTRTPMKTATTIF